MLVCWDRSVSAECLIYPDMPGRQCGAPGVASVWTARVRSNGMLGKLASLHALKVQLYSRLETRLLNPKVRRACDNALAELPNVVRMVAPIVAGAEVGELVGRLEGERQVKLSHGGNVSGLPTKDVQADEAFKTTRPDKLPCEIELKLEAAIARVRPPLEEQHIAVVVKVGSRDPLSSVETSCEVQRASR